MSRYYPHEYESKKALLEATKYLLEKEEDPKQKAEYERQVKWWTIDVEMMLEGKAEYDVQVATHKARVGTVVGLGSFEATSNKLRITDPCYSMKTWCAGTLENTLPGKWFAYIQYRDEGDWGIRNSTLIAVHESCLLRETIKDGFLYENHLSNLSEIHVGVDSGQAGIFDLAQYPEDPTPSNDLSYRDDPNSFYERCGDASGCVDLAPVDLLCAGVIKEGCVSRSGDGDGGYRCFFNKNVQGQIDAVEISFYWHDDELDEEEEMEEEQPE